MKEELTQLSDMFRMRVDIHEKQEEIDEEYDDNMRFDDLDQKIFSFKHKVHNWLKEGEKMRNSNQVSRCSSKSSSKYSSKSNAKSSSSSKSRSSLNAKAMEEKDDGIFLYQEQERSRVSESVPYGGGRIIQSSSKNRNL